MTDDPDFTVHKRYPQIINLRNGLSPEGRKDALSLAQRGRKMCYFKRMAAVNTCNDG